MATWRGHSCLPRLALRARDSSRRCSGPVNICWRKAGMPEFVLKYADGRGQIHQQVATAGTEKELRDRYTTQGFLIYSVKPRAAGALAATGMFGGRKKLNLEKFLIFNQQFVTLIRAGLPILKALDLLAERLTDPKLGPYVKS